MNEMTALNRRGLLKGSAVSLAAAGPIAALINADAARAQTNANGEQLAPVVGPYGPLQLTNDLNTGLPLLWLPKGFSYRSVSWRGDLMDDGQRVPAAHDGMAVVRTVNSRTNEVLLIRNHEITNGTLLDVPGNPDAVYDRVNGLAGGSAGGCTVLRMRGGQLIEHKAVIGATIRPCAGGPTPWGTWLSAEETTINRTSVGGRPHGYVFDVHPDPAVTRAIPIVDMGRLSHEACAVDPVTGYVYETEDQRNVAAFYRFLPNNTSRTYGALWDGGKLQAARIVGIERANLLALEGVRPSDVQQVGQSFAIEWVDVANPDANPTTSTETGANNPDTGTRSCSGPYRQARDAGALRMSRGEGLWWDQKTQSMFICDTSFGYNASGAAGFGLGAVWQYKPSRTNPDMGTLTLIHAPAARIAGNNVDNVCVSPKGGILTCDDGSAVVDQYGPGQRLMGYTAEGLAYIFAKSNVALTQAQIDAMGRTGQFNPGNYRGAEFAGATFDAAGRMLYVNNYTPGITFAIDR
ncbi:MAG: alkaline phosphatase PhoX, partial [Sphingomonadaceae bacterium]